ncbi:hypothetical protein PR048_012320 [Dryococelus australis]|uniref:Uncharacterized protein n=1 Tax=Dryococelus australis TaxID=614101 RepID=A0ABQ9HP14_9NEOP|nr:hypothetical protein PR048_012320 [Dryococelus australis]
MSGDLMLPPAPSTRLVPLQKTKGFTESTLISANTTQPDTREPGVVPAILRVPSRYAVSRHLFKVVAPDYERAVEHDTAVSVLIQQDPATWSVNITDEMIGYCVDKGLNFFSNSDGEFTTSARQYPIFTQKLTMSALVRVLKNGEHRQRKTLLYSKSTGNFFGFTCKLFSDCKRSQFVTGFSNWKKMKKN